MAQISSRVQLDAPSYFSSDRSEAMLRGLKARLHARFPAVGSSHLAEALASAQGFQTYAALRADMVDPLNWPLGRSFDIQRFRGRLLRFGYPVQPDFSFGEATALPAPPADFLRNLDALKSLFAATDHDYSRIRPLQDECAEMFADSFDLGELRTGADRPAVKRWSAGIDHAACLPGWGEEINHRVGGRMEFPGTDHQRDFFKRLPLSDGKFVEYQTAMVSLPYKDRDGKTPQIDAAAARAGLVGWTCTELPEWSWHMPGASSLVLFRPVSSHGKTLAAWEFSFKQWLLENATRLKRSAGSTRRKVIADIVDCQHLPLDLRDFEDCRERYLKDFAAHLYYETDAGMATVFENLMSQWRTEQKSAGPAGA